MGTEADREAKGAAVGILVMDAKIERIPGDGGNPASFPFPVLFKTVPGATLGRLIRERDPALVGLFAAAGRELIGRGARAVSTTCGFAVLFQQALADALPVPVFTSSLLMLPAIERSLGRDGRVGVLTADAGNLTPAHFSQSGADLERITVFGLEREPHFRRAVLEESGSIDRERVQAEVVGRARAMVAADPRIRAVLLECANLPPYAAAVRAALGLPVYDFTTLIAQVNAALAG